MGTMIPVATQALQAFQTISSVASVFDNSKADYQNNLALAQLQQQQNMQQKQAYQDALLNRENIAAQTAKAETVRKSSLKRAMARQRAEFGASGVGNSSNGSTEAVLLGLFEESEKEKENRERLDKIKIKALDQNLFQQKRVNTLKRTQATERDKLSKTYSVFDTASDLFNIF